MRLAEPGATLLGMAVVMQDSLRDFLTILGLTRRVIVMVGNSGMEAVGIGNIHILYDIVVASL